MLVEYTFERACGILGTYWSAAVPFIKRLWILISLVLIGEKKDVSFIKIDVDKNSQLASQYNVFSIPTFVIFNQGKVVSQFTGAMGKEGFVEEIEKTNSK